ncbi:MAG: hypothetical protein ABSA12_10975 [Verrucomicrobiia bacterium]
MNQRIFSRATWALCAVLTIALTVRLFSQTNASPALDARLQVNPDGSVSVIFKGVPGQLYRIEASDTPNDQTSWNIVAQDIEAGAGVTVWTDTTVAGVAQRYYQVIPQSLARPTQVNPTTAEPTQEASQSLRYVAAPQTILASQQLASNWWVDVKEAADSGKMIGALGAGSNATALAVLGDYGVAATTLAAMGQQIAQTPVRASLKEPFLRAIAFDSLGRSASEVNTQLQIAADLGYTNPFWVAKAFLPDWPARYDKQLAKCPVPPIAALDMQLTEVDAIRYFKWYDRYADRIHSVVLNWSQINNEQFKCSADVSDANLIMGGLYKLIKARNPNAFVWVLVLWNEDNTDALLLKSLTFTPDGLMIRDLRNFRSPFERARRKYLSILSADTPLLVDDFYGYWRQDLPWLHPTPAWSQKIGALIAPDLPRMEQRLQDLGYRGLAPNHMLIEAVHNAQNKSQTTVLP